MQISNMDNNHNDPSIVKKLLSSTFLRESVQEMRDRVIDADQANVSTTDFIKHKIMSMAVFFEDNFKQANLPQYTSDIAGYIHNIMSSQPELEKHAYLTYRVLDDKYKNLSKVRQQRQLEKIEMEKIQKMRELEKSINYSLLPTDYLRNVKNDFYMEAENRIDVEVVQNRKEIIDAPEVLNDLAYNSDNEKFKFQKAEIGKPLVTVEEMTKDQEYKTCLENIRETIDKIINAYKIIKENFTEKYIPLSLESAKKAQLHFELQLEMVRPLYDNKYRKDHWQMLKASLVKHDKSSAAAAKSTAVQCLWIVDRNGKPVFRNMTKEQIEAIDTWEFNFWINWINDYIQIPDLISQINEEHRARAIADRQTRLSSTLQHFA